MGFQPPDGFRLPDGFRGGSGEGFRPPSDGRGGSGGLGDAVNHRAQLQVLESFLTSNEMRSEITSSSRQLSQVWV